MAAVSYKEKKAKLMADLIQAKETGLKLVVFVIGNNCCLECDKIDAMRFHMDDVFEYQPLPYKKCVRVSGCACCYGFEPQRDKNGRLIKNK